LRSGFRGWSQFSPQSWATRATLIVAAVLVISNVLPAWLETIVLLLDVALLVWLFRDLRARRASS